MDSRLTYTGGSVKAPPSKSELHRMLFVAAQIDGTSKIEGFYRSNDVEETISVLKTLGAKIDCADNVATVTGPITKDIEFVRLKVLESGATLRFTVPLLGMSGISGEIDVGERLYVRFNDDDVKFYDNIGQIIEKKDGKIYVSGKTEKSDFEIVAKNSSQNLSGLLLALTSSSREAAIKVNSAVSLGYVKLTQSILGRFGLEIGEANGNIHICGTAKPTSLTVGGDWSAASTLFALGTASGNLEISGLDADSLQPDRRILKICNSAGAEISYKNGIYRVSSADEIKPINVNLSDSPDLFCAAAIIAALAKGKSSLHGTGRLKNKESDRLAAICKNLDNAAVKYEITDDCLNVYGGNPKPFEVQSFSDHRIYMAFTVLNLIVGGKITSDGSAAKSYPNFFSDITKLCQH